MRISKAAPVNAQKKKERNQNFWQTEKKMGPYFANVLRGPIMIQILYRKLQVFIIFGILKSLKRALKYRERKLKKGSKKSI